MNKFYKALVANASGELVSFFSPYPVVYTFGEVVKPKLKGTKLFVFDDLKVASEYAGYSNIVFECEVENPQPCWLDYRWDLDCLADFFSKPRRQGVTTLKEAAEHSFCVDSVKLTKLCSKGFYKVLRKKANGQLVSPMSGYPVIYSRTERTEPEIEGTELFVFDCPAAAAQYCGNLEALSAEGLCIFECLVEFFKPGWLPYPCPIDELIKKFRDGLGLGSLATQMNTHSYTAKSVILLRELV